MAWSIWVVGALLYIGGIVLGALDNEAMDWQHDAAAVTQSFAFLAIGAVGLLLSIRRPANSIGWIYLATWLGVTLIVWVGAYATWATVTHPGGVGGTPAVWLNNWLWVPVTGVLFVYQFLLFPDGHLLNPRWKPVAWAGGIVTAVWSVMFAFEGADYTDASGDSATNPYTPTSVVEFFNVGRNVLALAFLVVLVLSVTSLVLRFRRSAALERAQIKWLMLAGFAFGLFFALPADHGTGNWVDILAGFVWALLPVTVGLAILRYRLYDIDRIISRTATYLVVTGILLLVYVAVVTAVSQIVPDSSDLAVAAATLAAAAVFSPVATRVRRAVDRRFNRARYDAEHTIDAFAARLSGGMDPGLVTADLLAVVDGTLEPAQTGLWVRTR
ncbi:MAG TPA: hypothetical protein VMT88_13230 [Actinomycetes bacterium]|nr:hypothetical protein [Actinomycetes bacterium]